MLGRQHDGGDLNLLFQTRTTKYQSPVIHMYEAWVTNRSYRPMNIHIVMTSLESQRPVRPAHMPGVQQWIDENSKSEEEGLCSTQKSNSVVFGVVP